jgi:Cu/Ag efflux protein CusF
VKVTYRVLMVAVAVVGLGFGMSFAAGVAYGHGNAKPSGGGLTEQQLNSILGINTGGVGGAGASSGGQGALGGRGAAAQALSNSATGQITDISGNTVTIQTRTGTTEKVNVSNSTTIEKLASASLSDLKNGDSVIVSGSRNADGSLDAKDISPVPAELQALIGGAAGGAGTGGSAGGGQRPSPTPSGR